MRETIIQALLNLHNRTGKEWIELKSIYEEVEKIRGVENANGGASIRACIERHTKGFEPFQGEELFVSYEKGTGLYKLSNYEEYDLLDNIQEEMLNEITYEIVEIEKKYFPVEEESIKKIKFVDEPLNIRKYKKTGKHVQRSNKPDYIAQEIVKTQQGIISEKTIYEEEIARLYAEEAEAQVKLMEEFFNNKKENEGFDILSFEKDESDNYVEKYIEVKSTKGNESTPIDITIDEIEFAKEHIDNYYLYRIINSDSENRYYKVVTGKELLEKFQFIPISFKIYAN